MNINFIFETYEFYEQIYSYEIVVITCFAYVFPKILLDKERCIAEEIFNFVLLKLSSMSEII